MREVIVLSILFWLPVFFVLLRNFFWDIYFWQIKEYRVDRLVNHLKWDLEERNRNALITGIKFILFGATTLLFEEPIIAAIAILIAYILWINEALIFIQNFISKKIVRPAFKSPRNILILGILILSLICLIILITAPFANLDRQDTDVGGYITDILETESDDLDFTYSDIYIFIAISALAGLFIDIASFIFVSIAVFITSPVAYIRRALIIRKAKKKFELYKNKVVVIGITGSQGKTTTKEVLYEILKDNFKVAKTPENYNTDIGVAQAVLTQIKKGTEIFIAEMGAYKKGEIKKITKLFPPDISIVTDIDVQHLGLFGGKQKLFEGKAEIVTNIKPGGIVVANGDMESSEALQLLTNNQAFFVYTNKEKFKNSNINKAINVTNILGEDIKEKDGVSFNLKMVDDESIEFKVPQKGKHLVLTYMLAITTAKTLGLKEKDIAKKLESLNIKLPRLSIETGDNDTIIINDTYNSSFKGFIAATDVLHTAFLGNYSDIPHKAKTGRRIVVTKGIYELGSHKEKIYSELVEKIRDKIDILITSDYLLYKALKKDNVNIELYLIRKVEDIIYKIQETVTPNDIILLEGKLNPKIIKTIVSDKA